MPIDEVEITSTQHLIETVLGLSRNDAGGAPRSLWHRGHLQASWDLRPSLFRKLTSASEIFPTEQRLMTRFRERSLPYWTAGYPQKPWEHLFAMQHFGVPTRLLDWSENLMVALFFAGIPLESSYVDQPDDQPVIWSLDPLRWNQLYGPFGDNAATSIFTTDDPELETYGPHTPETTRPDNKRQKTPVAMYGIHNSPRIVAQRGTFTIAGPDLRPLDEFADKDEIVLWKLVLTYGRATIQQDLAALGFTQSMIFPDLVGLSREITAAEGL